MRSNDGQTLLELVIATGIVAVALTAMVGAAIVGVKTSRVSTERGDARRLIENRMDAIRSQRDIDPQAFFDAGPFSPEVEMVGDAPVYTIETVYTEVVPGQEIEVYVEASWEDGENNYAVSQTTTLTIWE